MIDTAAPASLSIRKGFLCTNSSTPHGRRRVVSQSKHSQMICDRNGVLVYAINRLFTCRYWIIEVLGQVEVTEQYQKCPARKLMLVAVKRGGPVRIGLSISSSTGVLSHSLLCPGNVKNGSLHCCRSI